MKPFKGDLDVRNSNENVRLLSADPSSDGKRVQKVRGEVDGRSSSGRWSLFGHRLYIHH